MQLQAAKELGSLSTKKRSALRDLTNKLAFEDAQMNSPIRKKTCKAAVNNTSPLTQDLTSNWTDYFCGDDIQDNWLSSMFPAKLADMRGLQNDQHKHVFEIENRRLSHVGAMPTPKRSSPAVTKTRKAGSKNFTFRFIHAI